MCSIYSISCMRIIDKGNILWGARWLTQMKWGITISLSNYMIWDFYWSLRIVSRIGSELMRRVGINQAIRMMWRHRDTRICEVELNWLIWRNTFLRIKTTIIYIVDILDSLIFISDRHFRWILNRIMFFETF